MDRDAEQLRRMGYAQQLLRDMGGFANFALTLSIAASLAELASAYPTAGALYHWSSILGGRAAGWFTAWLNTIGQFAITAGIDYGLAEFLAAMFGWEGRKAALLLFTAILLLHASLNHRGVRLVARPAWPSW